MSLAELDVVPAARPRQRGATGRLLRSELRLVFGRRRNQVLLVALALVPLIVGLAVRLSTQGPPPGEGPAFLTQISSNGLFLVFTSLVVCLPLFLPLTVGIVSGDAVAGEASAGTLRYLLTVPVSRPRLLLVKFAGSLAFAAAAVLTISVVGLIAGAGLFGLGEVTLLSGDTVGLADGLLRCVAVAAYVTLSLTGLVAVGLFVSTLTEVPVGAMATTIVIAVTSSVLDALPQLSVIHPYLLTHHWLDFGELLRSQVDVG
ncbi:MAG: ABC transporter permease, partial [Frankiales bacterium]|nr:ABC transporter permease [Frankiales bacterium]